MFGFRKRRAVVGVAAGLLMATAACSSQGGAQSAAPAATNSPHLTIAMVTHAPPGDVFWDQIQKGAKPFTYDYSAGKQDVTVNLADQASKDVLGYWSDLSKKGLVGKQDQFTTDYISGVVGGKYATYTSAAWAPGYLTGAGVGKGSSKGVWAVAPLPQWDTANPVSVNWGGSAFSVTSQATNKKLAAIVAKGIYADDCIVDRVVRSRVYIVGTNDRELKRRLRKIPGVPVVSVKRGGYIVERLPDVGAGVS